VIIKLHVDRMISVAEITFLDGLRKHTVMALVVLALILEVCGVVFMDFFGHDVGRASSDFLVSVIWLSGMLFLYFHAVQSIAWGEDQKVSCMILSRPITRTEYVLGTFVGLAGLLLILQFILGGIAWVALVWIKSQLEPQYFTVLNSHAFVLSVAGIMLMQLCILAVIVLLCCSLRGSFMVLTVAIAYYSICSGIPVVLESIRMQMESFNQGYGVYYLLQALSLVFPDFSRLDFKDAILSVEPALLFTDCVLRFALNLTYMSIVLSLACYVYTRRDL